MNKIKILYKKYKFLFVIIIIYLVFSIRLYNLIKRKNNIRVALCTMGKKENLYAKEFMEYYIKLGVDHLFIYDNNDPFTEKIQDVSDKKYNEKITFYETKNLNINYQRDAFNDCYQNNYKKFDWFLMIDMDEYLYVINNTLKSYLNSEIFDKCDFIKIHWAESQDNGLLYYDSRPLFKRFKKPYIKSKYIKTIIRGNIPYLKYWVHSPYISPIKNVTCTNDGNIIKYTRMNFETIRKINTKKAFLIHFRFKSTEEFINKYKRGYSNWHGKNIQKALQVKLATYFAENKITLEKIKYIERELKLNLSFYRALLNLNKSNNIINNDFIIN